MTTASRDEAPTVLVTGGAGFIGSHTCVELLEHGYRVVVVDNHANSSPEALARVEKIAGAPLAASYQLDLRDADGLDEVFRRHSFDAVIHFAAMKSVRESVEIPLEYYDVNLGAMTSLLKAMQRHGVDRLVFSSSCSIYGESDALPLTERSPAQPTNAYARSKWICEQMLADLCRIRPEFAVLSLRYFNPAGAHPSGQLGEDPRGIPGNVMPFAMQVAVGRRENLSIFGGDFETPDGTALRDYIHVVDVADGHRVALEKLGVTASGPLGEAPTGIQVLNLGTGKGSSVLELVHAIEKASGRPVPYEIIERRAGDVTSLIASAAEVERLWGWRTTRDLEQMCADAWRFQEANPDGYGGWDANA
ncbi:UDP-glucose 4-epimerase GalE [Actinospica durhamensis]|uniref:UDP-glucose 4-epimerase n=1 Tax=Actinospica durhamensis TaxID=1508375 RepID=A0A941IPI0_9ACTN|nr:UDP-glucose 4-epimerase GalE [Actinospica durhamensis]MBR7833157.1 UDP-glucose 4-epimerase GalE [Actinospica durhamensis]